VGAFKKESGMKFKITTYENAKIESSYLGGSMSIPYYGSTKHPSKEKALALFREHITQVSYHQSSQEYDVYINSRVEGYITLHTKVKVSETVRAQISALQSQPFMYQNGQEDKKESMMIKILHLLEIAYKDNQEQ
jgi:hypothetical protein